MTLPEPLPPVRGAAYRVPRASGPVDLYLDGNEGPTPDPVALQALRELEPETLRRYPDAGPLTEALAARLGVSADRVLVTAGADEALDRFCRAFLAPGRNVVVLAPAFEMTLRYAELTGVEVRQVWWTGGDFPVDAVLGAIDGATCAVALATPNNPTGLAVPAEELLALCRRVPDVWWWLDLVYAGFLDRDPSAELLQLPNTIVLQSFSKFRGLAGLRVGAAAGPPAVIAALSRAGGPYSVAAPSLAVAAAALEAPPEAAAGYVARVAKERAALGWLLAEAGAEVPEAAANFVLARTPRAEWLFDGLAGLGIAVRRFPAVPQLQDALRISCPGDDAKFRRLHAGIRAVLAPEAVLFDLDGVLADVSASYREAIRATAAEFGVTVTPGDIAAQKAAGDANNDWAVTHRLVEAGGGQATLQDVTARFEAHYQGGLWQRETLRVGADWLRGLATRCRLGIVTGRPRADADRFLSTFGLEALFEVVVCMGDAAAKPSPAPVQLALERLGVEAAWLLGDTVDDVRSARDAGVVPLGVVAPGEDPAAAADTLTRAGAARVLPEIETMMELLP